MIIEIIWNSRIDSLNVKINVVRYLFKSADIIQWVDFIVDLMLKCQSIYSQNIDQGPNVQLYFTLGVKLTKLCLLKQSIDWWNAGHWLTDSLPVSLMQPRTGSLTHALTIIHSLSVTHLPIHTLTAHIYHYVENLNCLHYIFTTISYWSNGKKDKTSIPILVSIPW